MRVRPAYVAAAAVVLLGLAGLVRGAGAPADASTGASAGGQPGVSAGDIAVSGAYGLLPAGRGPVEVYLTIANRGSRPDTLESISTGAAKKAELHDVPGLRDVPGQAGRRHQPAGPLTIPPGGTVTLAPGGGHIMLESPDRLKPGDRVSLVLTFSQAGQVLVEPALAAGTATATTGGTG